MSFLENDYEPPTGNSSYMRLDSGDNKIRILTKPIMGWEDWKDKKPVRFRYKAKPEKPIDPSRPIRHFWAFVVWNYGQNKIMIYQVVQASIQKMITALSKDSDWGEPFGYDLKIVKRGQKMDTEYTVTPLAHKPIDQKIKDAFYERPIDLEQMFAGADPFSATNESRTKAFWESEAAVGSSNAISGGNISKEQVFAIDNAIEVHVKPVDPSWRDSVLKEFKIVSFDYLPAKFYAMVMRKIDDKREQLLAEEEVPF